ncbi:MAG: hypothetical protein FWC66_00885 [Oscillospiraceae bacterium]|nr:hypothetical protein [Oscillospiraceae bacterium]
MSAIDMVSALQNQTAIQNRNAQSNGNAGDVMGRHDFLMLLSAQLRHQDPLNPQSDADFAAQLAQFSALEQMMNMSQSLTSMQAFSLVGQYVIAESLIDGRKMEIAGIVDSIFTMDGRKFAQIGAHHVPVSDITEVFDGSIFPTPEQLIQTSNNLIGRIIKARIGEGVFEGVVIGVSVSEKGQMQAAIGLEDGGTKLVPVGSIFDIRSGSEVL